ncbi:salivary peroxidase/catechol oxidase-like [Diadema setosum]|uniref:salivary peroxidase/catechol oxidase-like n=1 Tax=Diadema setosum TaxID=31175 RepID=UPI003B3BBAD0
MISDNDSNGDNEVVDEEEEEEEDAEGDDDAKSQRETQKRDATSIFRRYGIDSPYSRSKRSADIDITDRELSDVCDELGYFMNPKECRVPSLYRYHSADGSCNNLKRPYLGKSWMPHARYLPADYGDGREALRQAAEDRALPSTRVVSNVVVRNDTVLVPKLTSMTMHFGQLLDHDIGHTPVEPDQCGCMATANCIPIAVPPNDPAFHTRCIPLSRSKTVPRLSCSTNDPREQVNQLTSFIDASLLYGSSTEDEQELRGERGLLRVSPNPFNASLLPYLPEDETNKKCDKDAEFPCGKAGDKRAAVQVGLTALHTVFLRYHNKVARRLSKLNPLWDHDRIYLESRKILSSVLQHITYNEYLPITIGRDLMDKYRLSVGIDSPYTGYHSNLDPSLPNVFAHAAFRMGHSQISTNLTRADVRYREVFDPVVLRLAFFNGSTLFDVDNGGIDSLVRGMMVQPLDKIDRFFSDDVTRFLFADPTASFGLDLVAINTQRGRDHGIPGYTKWRQFCGLPNVTSFEGLADVMKPDTIAVLKEAYTHVDDVDAFIGMVVEEPVKGALVGPTVGCILGKHFYDLKYGDRFWYENSEGIQALSLAQQKAIRQMTFARMICDTLDNIETIQPFVFYQADTNSSGRHSFAEYSATHSYPDENGALPGFQNLRLRCDDTRNIPDLELRAWSERSEAPPCGPRLGEKQGV